ncbi:Lrp/AsnC family transcriptional regulator [Streptomyces sp. NBC_01306]|uniref:Lrp/AsnC family transcriptional regulator n=1 Tax=Streptomyces sp. NBC_01306 TaxID=2903819 RepID=UPI00225379AD|nr:AsnC family transcriptional regulator [Streptomyces sp. NBC_01306]MCX4725637.1 AsnC family transcriptional regulator [Streptomyces sp. NBC_01306]
METLDRQLINALKNDGRAPFRRIASQLGVSDQVVARRYQRLCGSAGLRVRGRVNGRRLGQAEWLIRLQCVPSASRGVAQALAQRDDTHWVRLASGGTEVICHVQARSTSERDALLLDRLPATRRVTAISAHQVLRRFRGGPVTWQVPMAAVPGPERADADGPAVRQGGRAAARQGAEPVELDSGDLALLGALARDGRASHALLAAELDRHESTVRRRIGQLRADGVLYFDVDFDEAAVGYADNAVLWISVAPSELDAVGRALARLPDVPFAAATTGQCNLVATMLSADHDGLYEGIAHRVGSLPGIHDIQTAPVIRTVKRVGEIGRALQ